MKHLRALLVLLVHLGILVLGTPGLDYQKWRDYDTGSERAQAMKDYGPVWGRVLLATADVNRYVRTPLYKRIEGVQRPFRIRQSWHLYRDGPNRVRRLEIRVDDQLLHRSGDPDYTWRNAQLRNRKLRPIAENIARKTGTPNWRGLVRWIVTQARADHPDAQEVRIQSLVGRYPGDQLEPRHSYVARAPDWKLLEIRDTAPASGNDEDDDQQDAN